MVRKSRRIIMGVAVPAVILAAAGLLWYVNASRIRQARKMLDHPSDVRLRQSPNWSHIREMSKEETQALSALLQNTDLVLFPSQWEPVGDVLVGEGEQSTFMITYSHGRDIAVSRERNGSTEWRIYCRTTSPVKDIIVSSPSPGD